MSKLKTMFWKLFGYPEAPSWHDTTERKKLVQSAKKNEFQRLVLYIYDELVDQDQNWYEYSEMKKHPATGKNSPEWEVLRTQLLLDIVNHERDARRLPTFSFQELHDKVTQHKFFSFTELATKAAHLVLS